MELLRINGLTDKLIADALTYLRTQTELDDIGKINGYDSWDAFFIMFCIKAAGSPHKDLMSEQGDSDNAASHH